MVLAAGCPYYTGSPPPRCCNNRNAPAAGGARPRPPLRRSWLRCSLLRSVAGGARRRGVRVWRQVEVDPASSQRKPPHQTHTAPERKHLRENSRDQEDASVVGDAGSAGRDQQPPECGAPAPVCRERGRGEGDDVVSQGEGQGAEVRGRRGRLREEREALVSVWAPGGGGSRAQRACTPRTTHLLPAGFRFRAF